MESTDQQQTLHLALVSTSHCPHTVWTGRYKFANPAHVAGSTYQSTLIEPQHERIQHAINGIFHSHFAMTPMRQSTISKWNTSQAWCCHTCNSLFRNMDKSLDVRSKSLSWPRGLGSKDYAIVTLALSWSLVTAASTPALGVVCLLRPHTFDRQLSRVFLDLSTFDESYYYRNAYSQHNIHSQRDCTSKMALVPQRRFAATTSRPLPTKTALNITLGIEQEFMILESYEAGKRPTHVGQESLDHGKSLVSQPLQKPTQLECSTAAKPTNLLCRYACKTSSTTTPITTAGTWSLITRYNWSHSRSRFLGRMVVMSTALRLLPGSCRSIKRNKHRGTRRKQNTITLPHTKMRSRVFSTP
jgi:hypothetical protein